VIQREIADPLATLLLEGAVGDGAEVVVDAVDGAIAITPSGGPPAGE
jgi:hypothetical protein